MALSSLQGQRTSASREGSRQVQEPSERTLTSRSCCATCSGVRHSAARSIADTKGKALAPARSRLCLRRSCSRVATTSGENESRRTTTSLEGSVSSVMPRRSGVSSFAAARRSSGEIRSLQQDAGNQNYTGGPCGSLPRSRTCGGLDYIGCRRQPGRAGLQSARVAPYRAMRHRGCLVADEPV